MLQGSDLRARARGADGGAARAGCARFPRVCGFVSRRDAEGVAPAQEWFRGRFLRVRLPAVSGRRLRACCEILRVLLSIWGRLCYYSRRCHRRHVRVVAQFGRALRSGRRGRRFKSCQPDQKFSSRTLPCAGFACFRVRKQGSSPDQSNQQAIGNQPVACFAFGRLSCALCAVSMEALAARVSPCGPAVAAVSPFFAFRRRRASPGLLPFLTLPWRRPVPCGYPCRAPLRHPSCTPQARFLRPAGCDVFFLLRYTPLHGGCDTLSKVSVMGPKTHAAPRGNLEETYEDLWYGRAGAAHHSGGHPAHLRAEEPSETGFCPWQDGEEPARRHGRRQGRRGSRGTRKKKWWKKWRRKSRSRRRSRRPPRRRKPNRRFANACAACDDGCSVAHAAFSYLALHASRQGPPRTMQGMAARSRPGVPFC